MLYNSISAAFGYLLILDYLANLRDSDSYHGLGQRKSNQCPDASHIWGVVGPGLTSGLGFNDCSPPSFPPASSDALTTHKL